MLNLPPIDGYRAVSDFVCDVASRNPEYGRALGALCRSIREMEEDITSRQQMLDVLIDAISQTRERVGSWTSLEQMMAGDTDSMIECYEELYEYLKNYRR